MRYLLAEQSGVEVKSRKHRCIGQLLLVFEEGFDMAQLAYLTHRQT